MDKPARLFIISAPSGAGKTSLVHALVEQLDNVVVSISHTTREKRPGEVDGEDYYFISKDAFEKMADEGEFIEYAKVFDNYYGTSIQTVKELLQKELKVILEIDWQGARQVRTEIDDIISIYILPPSEEELESRLRHRGQDSDNIIAQRMSDAKSEICHFDEYDYVLINKNFDQTLRKLSAFISNPESYLPFDMDKVRHLALNMLNRS